MIQGAAAPGPTRVAVEGRWIRPGGAVAVPRGGEAISGHVLVWKRREERRSSGGNVIDGLEQQCDPFERRVQLWLHVRVSRFMGLF